MLIHPKNKNTLIICTENEFINLINKSNKKQLKLTRKLEKFGAMILHLTIIANSWLLYVEVFFM